jgi:putative membrane protein
MQAMTMLASANDWHDGGWWIVFPIFWLLVAAFVLSLVWRRCGASARGDSPRRILGERFARGEISADEYRDRLSHLR